MDNPALSEAQQQQYYSSQQQEQQAPHYDQQAAYAQSYAAYYAAYHHQNQQQDPSQYHQQQYGASAYPLNHYHQYYYSGQDSSYYQAGTAQPQTEGVGPSNPSQIQGHVYAASATAAAPPQDQRRGLNSAADAALSQLSQLADTMDRAAAEAYRHLHGMGGPPQPVSRGRGRSSNRGGGRGNFIHQPSRQDGGESSVFRGRGRGQGRGLMGRSRSRKSYQSAPETATVGGQSLVPGSAQQARRPVLPVAWCDICRVDCNTLEILEQHKSGKRHKKTVHRIDEIQKQQRLRDEMRAKIIRETSLQSTEADPAVQTKEVYQSSSVVGIAPNVPCLSAQVGHAAMVSTAHEITPNAVSSAIQVDGTNRDIGAASENKQTAELALKQDFEIAGQKGQTKVATEEMAAGFDSRRGGLKRQMTRFGRGGKRLKSFDRVRERPRDQPRVCTICSTMCDTLAVFECHLSGKKHLSKMRRYQGQGSAYGPITVYVPPDQPSTYPTKKGQEPLFYGLKCHEMLQQEANYGLRHYLSERTRDAEIGGPNSQAVENLDCPEGEFVAAVKEDKEGLSLLDNTVTRDTVAFETNSEAEVPFTTGGFVVPLPEFGGHLGGDVRLPGLGAEVEELGPNTEELA